MAKNTDSAAKWLAAMTAPQTSANYVAGIEGTTVNPMQRAADSQDLYLAGIQDAVNSGRMRAALLNTPLQAWKDGATKKGAGRLSSGATAAKDKVRAHFQEWTPIYRNISDTVQAMAKGGEANAVARMTMAYRMLKQSAGKSV